MTSENIKRFELIVKLIISYLTLLAFIILFYSFNTNPASAGNDLNAKGAVFSNLLVWSATMFTPVAAYFFYDSWKEQYNHSVYSKQIQEVLDSYVTVFYKMLTIDNRMLKLNFDIASLTKSLGYQYSLESEKIESQKKILINFEADMNIYLIDIREDLNKILQKVTIYTIFKGNPLLLEQAKKLFESYLKILEPLVAAGKEESTVKSDQFVAQYQTMTNKTIELATLNMEKTLLMLQKEIEA
jgi:hypothetical protein